MSAEPVSSLSDEVDPKGTKDAPGGQRDEQGGARVTHREIAVPWTQRRERWGKMPELATCGVCGRRLAVNWVRATPCLWCDASAFEAKEKR